MSRVTGFHLIAFIQYGFTLYYLFNIFAIPRTDKFAMFHTFGGELRFLTNWNLIRMLRPLVHFIAAIQFSYAAYFDYVYVRLPPTLGFSYGGKLKYLTYWDTVVQALFFTICLLNDLFGSNDIRSKNLPLLRRVKDFFHASIAFPLAVFVGVSFWGIYAVDRELVFPKAIDPYFPTWLNHVMHTNVVIFTVIELVSSFRCYPQRKQGLLAHVTFMLSYLIWTFIIYAASGRWVYPIMEVLNWPQKFLFIGVLLIFSLSLYFFGEAFNKFVWGKELRQAESSKKSAIKKKPKQT